MSDYDWPSLARECGDGVTFVEDGHTYHRDGQQLVPVTTICKAAIPDVRNVRRFWTERHRRIGQVAHACTALDDVGRLDEASVADVVRGRVEAWRAFRRDFARRLKICLIEQPLWSVGGTGGTTDRVVEWDDKLGVLDLKGMIEPAYVRLQTAGYAAMFFERTRELPRVRLGIGLNDDGTYDFNIWDSPREWIDDRAAWVAAVKLYNFWRAHNLLPPDDGE